MPTTKVTLTIDDDVLATLRRLAVEAGLPLSTYVTQAAEHHARIQDGLAAMREWQEEHGEFTDDEIAEARADLDRAEAGARAPRQRLAS